MTHITAGDRYFKILNEMVREAALAAFGRSVHTA